MIDRRFFHTTLHCNRLANSSQQKLSTFPTALESEAEDADDQERMCDGRVGMVGFFLDLARHAVWTWSEGLRSANQLTSTMFNRKGRVRAGAIE